MCELVVLSICIVMLLYIICSFHLGCICGEKNVIAVQASGGTAVVMADTVVPAQGSQTVEGFWPFGKSGSSDDNTGSSWNPFKWMGFGKKKKVIVVAPAALPPVPPVIPDVQFGVNTNVTPIVVGNRTACCKYVHGPDVWYLTTQDSQGIMNIPYDVMQINKDVRQ